MTYSVVRLHVSQKIILLHAIAAVIVPFIPVPQGQH